MPGLPRVRASALRGLTVTSSRSLGLRIEPRGQFFHFSQTALQLVQLPLQDCDSFVGPFDVAGFACRARAPRPRSPPGRRCRQQRLPPGQCPQGGTGWRRRLQLGR